MLFLPSCRALRGFWVFVVPKLSGSRVLCRFRWCLCQPAVFYVGVDAFLVLKIPASRVFRWRWWCFCFTCCVMHAFETFVMRFSCVISLGCDYLLSWLVRCLFVSFCFSSLRLALLDCSVLLLSSLCFVLLRLASLLNCLLGILILPSPLSTSLSPAGWSYR